MHEYMHIHTHVGDTHACTHMWETFPDEKRCLSHYHAMPHFDADYIAVENMVRKGEIACNKQFLLFSQCFLLYNYMALIFHFKCTLKCCV